MSTQPTEDLYLTTMANGDVWAVPVRVIAVDRAKVYQEEFGGDPARSLREDTFPLFRDDFEVEDWAQNNMNWSDVAQYATLYKRATMPNAQEQESWVNGEHSVVRAAPAKEA